MRKLATECSLPGRATAGAVGTIGAPRRRPGRQITASSDGYSELGLSGLDVIGDLVAADYNYDLRNLQDRMSRFDEMRNGEPAIAVMEGLIKMPLQRATWSVIPDPNDKSTAGADLARRIERNLWDPGGMTHTWHDLLDRVLLSPLYGFTLTELVWEDKGNGFIGLRKMPGRSRKTVDGWSFDSTGGLRGFYQTGARPDTQEMISRRFIPIDRIVVWTWRPGDENNPEGLGALRQCWKPYRYGEALLEWAMIKVEREASGIPVVTPKEGEAPPTESEVREILSVLGRLRTAEDTGLYVPEKFIFRYEWPGSGAIPWEAMIERQHQYILQTLLCQFVGFSQGGDRGSYGLSQDASSMFTLALGATADWVCDVFNAYVIPKFVAYNHPGAPRYMPRLTHGQIGLRDLGKFGNFVRYLYDNNVTIPADMMDIVREEAGLPPQTEDEKAQQARKFEMFMRKNTAQMETPEPAMAAASSG